MVQRIGYAVQLEQDLSYVSSCSAIFHSQAVHELKTRRLHLSPLKSCTSKPCRLHVPMWRSMGLRSHACNDRSQQALHTNKLLIYKLQQQAGHSHVQYC